MSCNIRRHPLFFGGVDMPSGLSLGDRTALLEKENMMAEERDAKAREFQEKMERERKSQESEIMELTKRQESDRVAAIEAQESAAAEYSDSEQEAAMADRERRITGMWGALGSSQEHTNPTEETRPE